MAELLFFLIKHYVTTRDRVCCKNIATATINVMEVWKALLVFISAIDGEIKVKAEVLVIISPAGLSKFHVYRLNLSLGYSNRKHFVFFIRFFLRLFEARKTQNSVDVLIRRLLLQRKYMENNDNPKSEKGTQPFSDTRFR